MAAPIWTRPLIVACCCMFRQALTPPLSSAPRWSGAGISVSKTGGEALGENWTEDRRKQHEREHDVEHATVDQPLMIGVEGIEGHERRRESRRHLGQRERPDRQPLIPGVAELSSSDLRRH